ncbi:MAG TPA: DUF4232 domain-containing protein [Candidatus Saccharimonadales bacterium]|nr:DUF4232 domain-containing protein [Candidatus Saccharimonadales bacterium]
MKRTLGLISILLILIFVTYTIGNYLDAKNTKLLIADQYCGPTDLSAQIEIGHAAGNVYGNLTLQNISNKECKIIGNNFVDATYTVQNISVSQQGQASVSIYRLQPNQKVYSMVHYPNGPQCSGTKAAPISFSYKISPTASIEFKDANGQTNQEIMTCLSLTEPTDVQVWSLFSNSIINP